MRLYPEPIRFSESARDEANLHSLYVRYRYYSDTIRHGGCQWYVDYCATSMQSSDRWPQISLSKKTFVIVVCYRPDPTQNVDEKLKFVEACSSERRPFPPKVEYFPASPGFPQPPRSQACERSRFCIPRRLRRTIALLFRRVFEAMSLDNHPLSIPQALVVKCLARRNNF